MRRHLFRILALLLFCAGAHLPTAAQTVSATPMEVQTRRIDQFWIGRPDQQFGPLKFVGGLELNARAREFGGFSALRFLSPGERFMGVADTGFWYFGKVERDEEGRPSGIADFSMEPIIGPNGASPYEKELVDAEALAIEGDDVFVGFERNHRVSRYRLSPGTMGPPVEDLDYLIPREELRTNRGIETVLASPETSPFGGAMLVIAEMSINKKGDIFASVLDGPRKGVFFVARSDSFDITDGAFLPDGDILILERRFSMAHGVAMRLRRIASQDIRPGATVDGEVLTEADMAYQIDNMEGLDVWQAGDGTVRVSMISDDNRSFFQRTLYLEFIYAQD